MPEQVKRPNPWRKMMMMMMMIMYIKITDRYIYVFIYLNGYLLTPWSRVLLAKLTGFEASQEIPRIYGTRKFI
jgi:hypothetical protein